MLLIVRVNRFLFWHKRLCWDDGRLSATVMVRRKKWILEADNEVHAG